MTIHNSKPSTSRIRPSDLAQSVFQPKDNKIRSNVQNEPGTIVYTIIGQEDDKDEDGRPLLFDVDYGEGDILAAERREEACAKIVVGEDRNRFYVKSGPRGKLLNLIGMFDEGRSSQKSRAGESLWKYREVNKKVFDLYLNYLKTKNKAWLLNAEREAV